MSQPWNRSQGSGSKKPLSPNKRKPIRVIGLVCAFVFMLGCIGYLLFGPNGKEQSLPQEAEKVKDRIKEVAPANAPTNVVQETTPRRHRGMSREDKLKWFRERYGDNIPESLKTTVYFLEHPPVKTFKPKPRREDIFRHQSERTLASILLMEPGAFILRKSTYDEEFDENFKKSLEDPTLISKDDTDDQRELKNAVNEAKAELAERMRNGEKPSDILNSVMENAYELSKYKSNIQEMLWECEDDASKSDQDVEDFVAAANKLLQSKGAAPLEMPNLVRRQTRLRRLARQSEAESKSTKESK